MLRATLARRLGGFSLEAELVAPEASTLVIVGESASGKTTLLRLLAGLVEPDRGTIALGSHVLFDSERRRNVPAHERPVGYVPQDYGLFPHLNVYENVAFGPRAQGDRGAELRRRVDGILQRFALAPLRYRLPRQLSGGQQQRVALARALVLEPSLLLLDEPLSALDLVTRRAVRAELRGLLPQLRCTTIFVTHQPVDAMVFGDTILVLESGRVTQTGTRDDLLRQPRSSYVAEFLGVNLFIAATVEPAGNGLAQASIGGGRVLFVAPDGAGPAQLIVSPREITVSRERPTGSSLNVLEGVVEELVPEPPSGERLRLTLDTRPRLVAELTRASAESMGLRPGERVFASFKATGVQAFR
jgi:molybdate transport system ATP-binding protein